tara:strand:- start:538 stop:1800 length:1263 start_codon:yes stop_codon:yes gene_type:complete
MNYKLGNLIEIVSSTPCNYDHSVGYHDIKPFNKKNNSLIALHRYPLNTVDVEKSNLIDICLWDFKKNKFDIIDQTNAWSWEQGSRLQWVDSNQLIYNKTKNGKLGAYLYNVETGNKKILENPVYSIVNNNYLTLNYNRLWSLWKNYGYNINQKKITIENKPSNDGVFLCDFDNNKKLVLSIKEAVKICGLEEIDKKFFIAHPTLSPDGNKFVSLLRFFNSSGILISYFIFTDLENKESKVLATEKATHFEWINNNSIIVWSRSLNKAFTRIRLNNFTEKYVVQNLKKILRFFNPKIKQRILSTHFYLIDLNGIKKNKILDVNTLTEDGHPQISNNGKYLIIDTYANNIGFQKLMLYDIKNDKTYYIGEFKVAKYLLENNLKYDLHPRWDNEDNLISIDSSHNGSRQSYVIDIKKLIKNIN